MAANEFECRGCNSTFVIWDEGMPPAGTIVRCPRCKSAAVQPYSFPKDACRLYNLIRPAEPGN